MGLFEGTVTYGTQISDHQYIAPQLHYEPPVCNENLLFQKLKSYDTSDSWYSVKESLFEAGNWGSNLGTRTKPSRTWHNMSRTWQRYSTPGQYFQIFVFAHVSSVYCHAWNTFWEWNSFGVIQNYINHCISHFVANDPYLYVWSHQVGLEFRLHSRHISADRPGGTTTKS